MTIGFEESVALVMQRWQSVLGLGFMIACMSMCNYALLNWGPAFFQRVHGWPRTRSASRSASSRWCAAAAA